MTNETRRIWRKRRDGQLVGLTLMVFTPGIAYATSHWGAHGMPPIPRDGAFWAIVLSAEVAGLIKLVWGCRCPGCDAFVWPLQSHAHCGRCKQVFDTGETEAK